MPRSRIKPYSDTLLTWKSLTVEKKLTEFLLIKKMTSALWFPKKYELTESIENLEKYREEN